MIARGNNGQRIFLKQPDYEAFLEALRVVRKRYPFYLYAYVLMSNHFHLLLEVQRSSTARILQSLLTGYVRQFHRIHHHKGHLFQGRYKAILCDKDSYLLELVRYSISIPCAPGWWSERRGVGEGRRVVKKREGWADRGRGWKRKRKEMEMSNRYEKERKRRRKWKGNGVRGSRRRVQRYREID